MGKRAAGSVLFMVGLLSVASGMFFQEAGSGMVGFWRLEETSGPSMDSSGNNYTSAHAGVFVFSPERKVIRSFEQERTLLDPSHRSVSVFL